MTLIKSIILPCLLAVSVTVAAICGFWYLMNAETLRDNYFEGDTIRISRNAWEAVNHYNYIRDNETVDGEECVYFDGAAHHITDGALRQIGMLTLDAEKCGDLSFLQHAGKVNMLTIENAEYLTEEDYAAIGSMEHVAELTLVYDLYYLFEHPEVTLSAVRDNTDQVCVLLDGGASPQTDDMGAFLAYDFLKRSGLEDRQIAPECAKPEWFDEVMALADGVRKRADGDFPGINDRREHNAAQKTPEPADERDEQSDNLSILFEVGNYVHQYLTYDHRTEYEDSDDAAEAATAFLAINDYNRRTLSSIFNPAEDSPGRIDGQHYGICCNYAALSGVLLYELNIPSIYAFGETVHGDRHAWNLAWPDGERVLNDSTVNCTFAEGERVADNSDGKQYLPDEYFVLDSSLKEVIQPDVIRNGYRKADADYIEPVHYKGYELPQETVDILQKEMQQTQTICFFCVEAAGACLVLLIVRRKAEREGVAVRE